MKKHPLENEETFQKFVDGLCCNGCRFFVDKKCTEKDHEAHDADKSWTIQGALNEYLKTKNESEKEFVENINNYFLCEKFDSRKQ